MPKVNLMYQELFNHSVDVNDTIFERNDLFEFRLVEPEAKLLFVCEMIFKPLLIGVES